MGRRIKTTKDRAFFQNTKRRSTGRRTTYHLYPIVVLKSRDVHFSKGRYHIETLWHSYEICEE